MLSSVYPRRPAEQLFKLQIPLGFGGGQALAEEGGCVFLVMILTMMITTTMFSDLERRRKKGGVECVFLVIKYKNCVAENKRTKHISFNIQECVCQPNPDRSNSRPCWRGARRSCPCPHWSSFTYFPKYIYLFIIIIYSLS